MKVTLRKDLLLFELFSARKVEKNKNVFNAKHLHQDTATILTLQVSTILVPFTKKAWFVTLFTHTSK